MPHDDTRHPRKGVADGVVGPGGVAGQVEAGLIPNGGHLGGQVGVVGQQGGAGGRKLSLHHPVIRADAGGRSCGPAAQGVGAAQGLVPSRRSATRPVNLGSARESASGSAARRSAVIPAAAISAAEVTSAAATPPAYSSPQAGTMAGMSSAYGG